MTHETASTASKLRARLTFMDVEQPLYETECWKSSFQQRYLIAGRVQLPGLTQEEEVVLALAYHLERISEPWHRLCANVGYEQAISK